MVQAIAALGLRKEYRSTGRTWWGRRARPASDVAPVLAVDDVSFSIERGERVAFIGPNGAGKSTTIKILSGILSRSGGDVTVLGASPILVVGAPPGVDFVWLAVDWETRTMPESCCACEVSRTGVFFGGLVAPVWHSTGG